MNAKEISDATLPLVTPADNDLMLIYDTSEGTTGKATIASIAPKVAENIDISGVMTQFYITNRTEKEDNNTIATFLTPRTGKLYLKVTNYSHIDGTEAYTLFYIYKGNDISSGDLVVSVSNNGIYSVDCTANQPITINHELNAGGMYEMWYVND